MSKRRVLVVDDEEGMLEVCQETLEQLEDAQVVAESDPKKAAARLANESFDLLITDLTMPGLDGVSLLRHAREQDPALPALIMTGTPTVETVIECFKLGAVDYLVKPFHPEDLRVQARRFLEERRLREENQLLGRRLAREYGFDDLLGAAPSMEKVFETIRRVADSDVDVLIVGETGTGKELVARALHRRSRRAGKRFVPLDCGAIPENLLESELFGHEKGAFTGATSRNIGLLEFAHQGTFFLDELGELTLPLQAKLLRALQERRIRRIGSKTEVDVDIRVIAATSRDLAGMVAERTFRQDLLYRIDVVRIALPPLRERREDIPLLAAHFLARHAPEMGKPGVRALRPDALEVLAQYRWPGNVRELQNAVRRGIAMCRGEEVGVDDLPEAVVMAAGEEPPPRVAAAAHEGAAPASIDGAGGGFFQERARRMAAFEREYLTGTLAHHHGDVTAAARAAGIPRGTFYRLLKNHDLKPEGFRG